MNLKAEHISGFEPQITTKHINVMPHWNLFAFLEARIVRFTDVYYAKRALEPYFPGSSSISICT